MSQLFVARQRENDHHEINPYQAIPEESPNTILTNMCVVGSNGERTSELMFYVTWGFMKRFSGVVLISISLPATDLECLIKTLIFNSLKFKQIAFKQCSPLLAIPMIWNHLVDKNVRKNNHLISLMWNKKSDTVFTILLITF